MFSLKTFIVLVVLWQYNVGASAQSSEKFFRNDYTYFDEAKSFYKIHTIHKTWLEAKKACAAEGSHLMYPQDANEADVVTEFLKQTSYDRAFVGASALMAKGVYETIDGVPVQDLYHKWVPGEPDANDAVNCVTLHRDATLSDENCNGRYPFICSKTLASLQWNEKCNMPNTDYEYDEELDKCYKFHLNPMTWVDAYAACNAEQSYLTVVNSPLEADHLVALTKKAPKEEVDGYYLRGAVHVGFHNRTGEGWITSKGVPLANSSYSKWGYGEPNGKGHELCGSMFYTGELNDISCDAWKCFFICEHDVKRRDGIDTSKYMGKNISTMIIWAGGFRARSTDHKG